VRSVADCKAAAIWRANTLCEKHRIIKPRITYNLRGTDAGQAFLEQNRIDLNLLLFMENFADGIQNTIPHEVAHLEAYRRGLRRGDFHGERWKRLMRQFGAVPDACHNLEVDAVSSRTGYFTYRCKCNPGYMVSLEMHRRIQASWELFRCRNCRQLPMFIES
jgi:SprT protein